MKASPSIAILISLGAATSGHSQGWCDYVDDHYYYEEPYCEMVPLHEVVAGLIHYYMERPVEYPRPVRSGRGWEEPGRVPPRALRPPVQERQILPQEAKPPPVPRRVIADYKPPVPPPTFVKPELDPAPEKEIEIELAPEPESAITPIAVPVPGAPGFVFSPYDEGKRKVDVRGLPSGSMARDPYTKEIFRVP